MNQNHGAHCKITGTASQLWPYELAVIILPPALSSFCHLGRRLDMGEQGGTLRVENYPDAAEPCTTLKDRVLERIRKGEDFPATSATISLITRLTTANEASITELSNIILTDFGLTTKILKLMN